MFTIINSVFILFNLLIFLLIFNPFKKKDIKENLKGKTVVFFILFIGLVVRFYKIYEVPGLQIDEAMAGYDAWSLANYGVDSTTQSWPVYLYSYGTGQSAVYAYLAIPFIKLLGLTITAIRLPIIIISSLTLVFSTLTFFHTVDSKKWSFLFLITFATNPWAIASSRFGLDANLGPDFLLISICILLWALRASNRKMRSLLFIVALIFIALTTYAYSASWFVLPIFILFLAIYLLKNKYITLMQMFILALFLIILLIPILLFAFNQFFGSTNLYLLGLTIPKLSGTQLDGQTIFNGSNILLSILENLKNVIHFVFVSKMSDGLLFNSLPGFSVFYTGSLLLFTIGCVVIYKTSDSLSTLVKIWLISCIPIVLFTKPLVHHWNFLYFPIMLTIVFGLEFIVENLPPKFLNVFLTYTAVLFFIFIHTYFLTYESKLKDSAYNAPQELGNILKEINESTIELKKIYVYTNSFSQVEKQFIYLRFFDPISPIEWQATKDNAYDHSDNLTTNKYSNYYFIDENEITFEDQNHSGYLIHKNNQININIPEKVAYDVFENEYYYCIYFP